MGRPPDPARRERTLALATDYVLVHGLAGLSLRPLAAALDTSPRMLLYDFGSKQELVAAILGEARRRGAARMAEHMPGEVCSGSVHDRLRRVWAWISADDRAPYVRLFFEVHADGLVRPESHPRQDEAITDWFNAFGAAFRDVAAGSDDTVTPTLIMAVIRGLLFDLTATDDRARVDHALDRFADLLKPGAQG
ncbi:TetR/AcrR family transcriptional regulator [Actinomadura litoris]|uniref:TetR/AcrR family transcriptional regulator n=1 Tax=Actinomadura litoris TaxID=2678616 RepID=UPI001FA7DD35|nr:TetR/AcrR family transcriptional regulator [Actinomadura litoris]